MNVPPRDFSKLNNDFTACRAAKEQELKGLGEQMDRYEQTQRRLFESHAKLSGKMNWVLGGIAFAMFFIPIAMRLVAG